MVGTFFGNLKLHSSAEARRYARQYKRDDGLGNMGLQANDAGMSRPPPPPLQKAHASMHHACMQRKLAKTPVMPVDPPSPRGAG